MRMRDFVMIRLAVAIATTKNLRFLRIFGVKRTPKPYLLYCSYGHGSCTIRKLKSVPFGYRVVKFDLSLTVFEIFSSELRGVTDCEI